MRNGNLSNVLRAAASMPWAIVPEKLEAVCAVLEMRANNGQLTPEAIQAAAAQQRRASLSLGGAVAVIPISGVIAPRMNVMTEMSGGCSAEQLTQQIRAAVENPQVSAIVLDVDSPGGQVGGIPELAAKIRGWREVKPIVAVANHLMASAAYWLASAATEVVAAPSAEVGSIGVFTIHADISKADAMAGITRTLVKAGIYKAEEAPYFPLSDAAREHMQAKVDDYMAMFASDIAANRGTTVAKVMAGYGQGQCLLAEAAMAAGLVDRIGELEDIVSEMAGSANASPRTAALAAIAKTAAISGAAATKADDGDAPECPNDGTPMELEDDEWVCPECGYSEEAKAEAARASVISATVRVIEGVAVAALDVTSGTNSPAAAAVAAATTAPAVVAAVADSPAPRRGARAPMAPPPANRAIHVTASPAKEHHVSDQNTTSASSGTDDNAREQQIIEISALATQHACADKLHAWLEAKTPLDGTNGVRAQIANELRARLERGPQTRTHAVPMTEKEERQYSFARAIQSAADGSNSFEREVSDEIEKNLPKEYHAQGGQHAIFAPTSIRTPMDGQKVQAAGLDSGTATKGTELKFVQYGGFIDMLRNKARVLQAGARMLSGLNGPVTFVKQTGAGTFSWVTENGGADVAESNLLLGTVTLAAKTGQSTTSFSRQLLRQAVEDIESIVRNDLAAIHALGIDAAALFGSGASGQPTGVFNAAGVGVVALGTNGLAPTYNSLINQQVQVGQANADVGPGAFIVAPGMKGTLQTATRLANNIALAIWNDDDTIAGAKAFSTNQVQTNLTKGTGTQLHAIYYGVWQQLLIGEWGAMELVIDPYRLKKQGMIEVTSFEMIDIALRYAAGFSVIKDAISAF